MATAPPKDWVVPPLRLLYLENDEIQRRAWERTLKRWGYQVVSTASTEEAIARGTREHLHLALLDKSMKLDDDQDNGGLLAAQALKAFWGKIAPFPIIILTEYMP